MKKIKKLSEDEIDILSGLKNKKQKKINSKFFYDKKGSLLFNKITNLEEYYPTKIEMEILKKQKKIFSDFLPDSATVIEFGSGSNKKIKNFIKSLKNPRKYLPVDISKEYLIKNSNEFSKNFPNIEVFPLCADFVNIRGENRENIMLQLNKSKNIVGFFPGSTIGNFDPCNAKSLLKSFCSLLKKNNYLVISIDLLKKKEIIENAYNDKLGITARFNLNLLTRLNKEFNANFILSKFEHLAFFNKKKNRIEMHLLSNEKQNVRIFDEIITFKKGETIHTENSYKYSLQGFKQVLNQSGFKQGKILTDRKKYFAIFLLQVK